MAVRRRKHNNSQDEGSSSSIETSKKNLNVTNEKIDPNEKTNEKKLRQDALAMHLPPFPLVVLTLLCSGFLWMLAFRDLMATGKPLLGPMDEDFLIFSRSTYWFDGSKGWKSSAGGLSTIQSITTDANKMGDLFVRKLGGAANLGIQTQKLFPLLSHSSDVLWGKGHYIPFLLSSVVGNLAVIGFYLFHSKDFTDANVSSFPITVILVLGIEAIVMLYYAYSGNYVRVKTSSVSKQNKSAQKAPNAVTNRIVMRTVSLVSGLVTIIAGRDLFFPGQILPIPHDDIYLEWTGALIHSPPTGSPEELEYSMEAPLHIGDKFSSQLTALYMLVLCIYKFTTAFFVKYGVDGSGEIKCKMIWKGQAVAGCLIVFIFRMFAAASLSASLDLRWHLMCLTYEAFILGLNAFW